MSFDIVNDRLEVMGRAVPFVKANSAGGRFHPTLIVLHDTADRPVPEDTVRWFAAKDCTVSAHVVIERDGSITQMVPFDHKAFHAGKSCWNGQNLCNGFAIGIEIDNPGKVEKNGRAWFHKRKEDYFKPTEIEYAKTKEHGAGYWMPYTPEQIAAVTELCAALVEQYPTIHDIATHYLISPGRKVDVNPLFPLEATRAHVFAGKARSAAWKKAVYPPLTLGDRSDSVKAAQARLAALGYPVGTPDGVFGPQMRLAVLGFEAENNLEYDGVLSGEEHKILLSDKAKEMPVGARENITPTELKQQGSTVIKYASWGKATLRFFGLSSIAGLGDSAVNGGAGVNAAIEQLEAAKATVGQVSSMAAWAVSVQGIALVALIGGGIGLYYLFEWIIQSRTKQAQQPNVIR